MATAVILAGGKATRLGPLAAQYNKALVSFGSKPMLVHLMTNLEELGYDEFVVVTSPAAKDQIAGVLERSGLQADLVIQDTPIGPVDAMYRGVVGVMSEPVLVTSADTVFDPRDVIECSTDWAGVGVVDRSRSWCYLDGDTWVDGIPDDDAVYAYSGMASFGNALALEQATRNHRNDSGVSGALNEYERLAGTRLTAVEIPSWLDVGDVGALANARKTKFNVRSFNGLTLKDPGYITKTSHKDGISKERDYLKHVSSTRAGRMFPRLESTSDLGYTLEYIDLPTLAELYLYWPGPPSVWQHCVKTLLTQVSTTVWPHTSEAFADTTEQLFFLKPVKRFEDWAHPIKERDFVWINGKMHLAGRELLESLTTAAMDILAKDRKLVLPHGDLTFSNTLYGLGTDVIRLLDPRGDLRLDYRYDLAKLRFSYHGGLDAISHGLYRVGTLGAGNIEVKILPNREEESLAVDEVLSEYTDIRELGVLEALMFISSTPLHESPQDLALYTRFVQIGNEVLQ